MIKAPLEVVHSTVTKVYAKPAVKAFCTHTGVCGFFMEFLHTIHFLPLDKVYILIREPVVGWAALSLGLVVYCDNAAHHVSHYLRRKKPE